MSSPAAARWEQHNEAGRRSFAEGKLTEAEEAFRAAVGEAERLGADSLQLASSLNNLGQVKFHKKDLGESEALLTRALTIRETALGQTHPGLLPSLNNLAALHEARGDLAQAEARLQRALEIAERQGAQHPDFAAALNNLARLYFRRSDYAKADRCLLRLLELKEGVNPDHPDVAAVLASLAKLRQAIGRHDQAEELLRQALEIREKAFAAHDPMIAASLEALAEASLAVGKRDDAASQLERALGIRERAAGATHPSVSALRARLTELRPGAPQPSATQAPSWGAPATPAPQEDVEPSFSALMGRPRSAAPDLPDLPFIEVPDYDEAVERYNNPRPPTGTQRSVTGTQRPVTGHQRVVRDDGRHHSRGGTSRGGRSRGSRGSGRKVLLVAVLGGALYAGRNHLPAAVIEPLTSVAPWLATSAAVAADTTAALVRADQPTAGSQHAEASVTDPAMDAPAVTQTSTASLAEAPLADDAGTSESFAEPPAPAPPRAAARASSRPRAAATTSRRAAPEPARRAAPPAPTPARSRSAPAGVLPTGALTAMEIDAVTKSIDAKTKAGVDSVKRSGPTVKDPTFETRKVTITPR